MTTIEQLALEAIALENETYRPSLEEVFDLLEELYGSFAAAPEFNGSRLSILNAAFTMLRIKKAGLRVEPM